MPVHTIPPFFREDSRILILGSFPSPLSRQTGFYYGHPQNRFWKTLSAILDTQTPLSIEEKKEFLAQNKIALWDVIASCDIKGAGDNTIKNVIPNDFSAIEKFAPIRQIFTTGKTAEKLFRKYTGRESIGLPSPSPANCALPFEKLAEAYRVLIPYII